MAFGLQQATIFAERYRIVRVVGSGAMGTVYEVVHLGTNRRRALKLMHPHILERAEMRERFKLEARVTAGVSSERIVEVFDAGVDERTGAPYLVMELLEGEELGRRLKRLGRLSPEEAIDVLHQTAEALSATHRASIIHRDLKPGNIFLAERPGRSPGVKVLDFGLAKILAESAPGESATMAAGTPHYMAPEQFRGGKVSAATDIYALGMMAYTLLTGEAYWADEKRRADNLLAFALAAAQGPTEAASARAARRGVVLPVAFDAWFARVTAPQPAKRFAGAPEAVSALAGALGLPAPAQTDLPASARQASSSPDPEPTVPEIEDDESLLPAAGSTLTQEVETTLAQEIETTFPPENESAERDTTADLAHASTLAQPIPTAPAPAPSPPPRAPRRRFKLLAVLAGALAASAAALAARSPSPPPPAPKASPLLDPSSVLACPILEAPGDAASRWLGAAAAATLCERARWILGGRASRTLVPAELLDLPRQPADAFPIDPFAGAEARARSLAAAKSRASAYVDGSVIEEASGFRITLVLHRPDGGELGRASGSGRALYQAVREAMTPLVEPHLIPRAPALDPAVSAWSRARDVDASLALFDVALAMAQNAGGLAAECRRCEERSADLGEMAAAERWLCAYTMGLPPPEPSVRPADSSSPAAYVTWARLRHTLDRKDDPGVADELHRLFEREPSALGQSLIAATESCLRQSSDPGRAHSTAFLAVQADPRNPLGEFCAPWGQLVAMSRDTPSAASTVHAMQAWAPWDSSGWYMEALGPGDAERALTYARRAYTLTPFDTNVAGVLADLLLARGAGEEVRNIAVRVAEGGQPVHRIESDLLLMRIDAGVARLGAALGRALGAMDPGARESGWVQVLRFEIAWRAVELGVVLGRGPEIADRVVERFLDPEPPPLDGGYLSVPMRIPALCARASEAVRRRCFARFHALRERLSGGILPETDAFTEGAERYAEGDFPAAAKAWRPLLRQPGLFASVLPDAMMITFDRSGDSELVDRLETATSAGAAELGGASPALVMAARRAAKRGDRERARALARRVIEAWSVADETVPAVDEMRKLLARLR